MYSIRRTKKFDKDLQRCVKRGLPPKKLQEVLDCLCQGQQLAPRHRQHKLTGKYSGCWECHILADWLLIWRQDDEELVLLLTDTGSHADLFG